MFKHHNLTLKKGFEVKSGGTKLSKLMYIMILYWLLHIMKKGHLAIPQLDHVIGVTDQIRHCPKAYTLWFPVG